MANVWERFNNLASVEEVQEAKNMTFDPLDAGDYKVKLIEITAGESKSGLPMLKGKFQVIANNQYVFVNQLLQNMNYPEQTARNIASAVKLVNKLSGHEWEFSNLADFAEYITEVSNQENGNEYSINIKYKNNDTERKFPVVTVNFKVDPDFADIDDVDFE